MKNVTLFLVVSVLAGVAFADAAKSTSYSRLPASSSKLTVDCVSPKGFAGLSASLSGDLSLTTLSNGAAKAVGKLKIDLHDARKPWSGVRAVLGQYDDLTSVGSEKYFHGGATIKNGEDVMEIYVNFTKPDMSYVEYAGKRYITSCR